MMLRSHASSRPSPCLQHAWCSDATSAPSTVLGPGESGSSCTSRMPVIDNDDTCQQEGHDGCPSGVSEGGKWGSSQPVGLFVCEAFKIEQPGPLSTQALLAAGLVQQHHINTFHCPWVSLETCHIGPGESSSFSTLQVVFKDTNGASGSQQVMMALIFGRRDLRSQAHCSNTTSAPSTGPGESGSSHITALSSEPPTASLGPVFHRQRQGQLRS